MYTKIILHVTLMILLIGTLRVHRAMSWLYADAHRCPGCMSMLIDVLDVCQCSPMSWMYVDAHQCPGCMSMLTDVLDVCR